MFRFWSQLNRWQKQWIPVALTIFVIAGFCVIVEPNAHGIASAIATVGLFIFYFTWVFAGWDISRDKAKTTAGYLFVRTLVGIAALSISYLGLIADTADVELGVDGYVFFGFFIVFASVFFMTIGIPCLAFMLRLGRRR